MIDLIYDCDITMGLPGRDVDDGLALLYLLGSPEIRLLGITSTFGNSTIDEVHPCLVSVLQDLGRNDIPAYRGAPRNASKPAMPSSRDPGVGDGRADSAAARFLAENVRRNPGTVSILATGSPTNLLGAYSLHPGFFHDVKEIVFMGGVTEPLLINGREIPELNLSSDPEAALYSLYGGQPPAAAGGSGPPPRASPLSSCSVTVISGNLCLQAPLTRDRFAAFLAECTEKGAKAFVAYLEGKILPWFSWIEQEYDLHGFHAWDATAALYLTDPQLFEPRDVLLRSTLDDLRRGFLRIASAAAANPATVGTQDGAPAAGDSNTGDRNPLRINVPIRILNLPEYRRTLFAGWFSAATAWPE